MIGGKLKYFSNCAKLGEPKEVAIANLVSSGVFLLKNKAIFSPLIFCPDAFSYNSNKLCKASQSEFEALQKIMLSSAKNKTSLFIEKFIKGLYYIVCI